MNREAAETFTQWLLSETGQAAIAAYQVEGQQLFFPNANDRLNSSIELK